MINYRVRDYLDAALGRGGRIVIVSGEGDGPGTVEPYNGRRTISAIMTRLRSERAGGDRWAHALIETRDPGMLAGYAVRWAGTNALADSDIPGQS